MPFPALEQYLARLYGTTQAGTRVWADAEGRAQGRYFNSTLTSAFQSIREVESGRIVGYEGFARSYSENDQGLCLWKLLDHAANDEESVELDRLCRMLHSINFFRQPAAGNSDLYLSVHARLMAAVDGNHGRAFRHILSSLDLPQQRIVLQLPAVEERMGWLVSYVADNYRRNGFRIAVNAVDAVAALALVEHVRPEVIKVDTRRSLQDGPVLALLEKCAQRNIGVIFKRVENAELWGTLARLASLSGKSICAQGYLWDLPTASLTADKQPQALPLAARPQARVGVA